MTLRKFAILAIAFALASHPGESRAGRGLLGVFDDMKAKRQAKRDAAADGLNIVAALAHGKAVIFFPSSVGGQVWMDDLGDDSFATGGDSRNETNSDVLTDFIVVEPGTYYLQRLDRQDFHKTQHVQYAEHPGGPGNGIGQILVTNTQFAEPHTRDVWLDEQGENVWADTGQQQCWTDPEGQMDCQPVYGWVYNVIRQAGYYPETYYVDEDGVSISGYFEDAQSPARITVGIGEVVFTDKLWFQDSKSFGWNEDQCARAATNQWQCAMSSFRFLREKGDHMLADFQKDLVEKGWKQETARMIEYRPLEMNAAEDEKVDNWDRLMYWRNR